MIFPKMPNPLWNASPHSSLRTYQMSAIVINERVYDLWSEAREKQEWAAIAF